jgi:FkbM family methyltransferase
MGPLDRTVAAIRRRLDGGAREVRRLREQVRALKAESKAAALGWQAERETLKATASQRHRRVLDPAVLEAVLPLRAHALAAAAPDPTTLELDRRLQQCSPAYAAAVAALDTPSPELVETTIQGLPWCVPVFASTGQAARERMVAKQRFPYRALTQARELAQGPIMIDLGASIGRMSIPRVLLGDVRLAYCAEPDPLNFAALVRNAVRNGLRGRILPDCVAISDRSGTARLRHAKYSSGHSLVDEGSEAAAIEVPCRTLDQWCTDMGIALEQVTYVKVDTQGREAHVLRGAEGVLARPHIAWQLEVSPAWLRAAGTSAADLYALCAARFTHFIDLGKEAEGERVRPVAALGEALAYLGTDGQTDVLLFTAAAGSRLAGDTRASSALGAS